VNLQGNEREHTRVTISPTSKELGASGQGAFYLLTVPKAITAMLLRLRDAVQDGPLAGENCLDLSKTTREEGCIYITKLGGGGGVQLNFNGYRLIARK